MTTTDTTLLIILTSLLSIFILVCIAIAVVIFKLVRAVQAVVVKAESVVDSVEAAAEVFKDASGKMAMIKLIRNIVDLAHGKKGGKK
ncbi:MAG: hypothetical protein JWO41_574 [Candidatus Saccharibacteria bacterium]|nr:hypothetical protein [Candidatus Saccharibacteria bacterium]